MIASVREQDNDRKQDPGLPRDYIVLDVQTTGLGLDNLILRASHMVVRNGEIATVGTRLLDWTRTDPRPPKDWLEKRVAQTRQYHGISVGDLRFEGEDPFAVLGEYRELFRTLPAGVPLVGHGLHWFEYPLLQKHFHLFLGDTAFEPKSISTFDLGLLEKADQLECPVKEGETLGQFNERVHRLESAGISFNRRFCLDTYNVSVPVPEEDPCYRLYADRELYEYWHRLMVDQNPVESAGRVAASEPRLMTDEQRKQLYNLVGSDFNPIGVTEREAAGVIALHNPQAKWRQDPSTPQQERVLEKFGIWEPGLSKGQASEWIKRVFEWKDNNPGCYFTPDVDW